MAQQSINYGAFANDPAADTARAGAIKIDDNFDELYSEMLLVLHKADNLSGLANYATARSNLGLGTAAQNNTGDFDSAGAAAAAQAASQPLDSDLTAIGALTPTNDDIIQRKAGAWTNRTPAQFKSDLALTKSDIGLGNVDNTSDVNKPVSTAQAAADAAVLVSADAYADSKVEDAINDGVTTKAPSENAVFDAMALKQPLDSDLTTIAGLTPVNDDFLQYKSGAWANRTPVQARADLKIVEYKVGPGRQYTTIQSALTAIGNAASLADLKLPQVVYIAGGVYDEDLTIPTGRILTLVPEGTVILGNGAGSNWASTNSRNIALTFNNADAFGGDIKPAFNVIPVNPSDTTSTFIAEAGALYVSGNITIAGDGLTHTLNLTSTKVFGTVTKTAAGLTNFQAYRSYFIGALSMATATILERMIDCQFDTLITADGYNAFINCEIKAGMTVTTNYNTLPPSGLFNTTFTGVFTAPAAGVKLDLASDYFFTQNAATLGGAATKVIIGNPDSRRRIYVSKTNGVDTNQGSIVSPFKTIQAGINAANALAAYYAQVEVVADFPTGGSNGYTEDLTFSQQGVVLRSSALTNRAECFVKGKITINLTGTSGGGDYVAASNTVYIKGMTLFNSTGNTIEFVGSTFQRLNITDCYIDNTFATGSALLMTNTGTSGGTKSTITAKSCDWNNSSSTIPTVLVSAGRLFNYGTTGEIQNGNASGPSLKVDGASAAGPSVVCNIVTFSGQVQVTDNTATVTLTNYSISSGSAAGISTPSSPNTGYVLLGTGGITCTATNSIIGSGVVVLGGSNFKLSTGGDIVSTVTQATFDKFPEAQTLLGAGATAVTNSLLVIKNGHITTQRTTAPTVAANANAGTSASASLSNATDVAGKLSLTTGSAAFASGIQCTVTFNKAYAVAPIVVITPTNANAASTAVIQQIFITTTTTTFSINFGVADLASVARTWMYHVIETQ